MVGLIDRLAAHFRQHLPFSSSRVCVATGRAAAVVTLAPGRHPASATPVLVASLGRLAAASIQPDDADARHAVAVSLVVRVLPGALRPRPLGGVLAARALVVGCDAFHVTVRVAVEDAGGAPLAHATLLASLSGSRLTGLPLAGSPLAGPGVDVLPRTVWPN